VQAPVQSAQEIVLNPPQLPGERAFVRQGERNMDFLNPTTPAGPIERAFTNLATSAATEGNAVKRVVAGGLQDAGSAALSTVATLSSDRRTADQIAADRAILGEVSEETDQRNLGTVGQVLRPAAQNAVSNITQVVGASTVGGFPAVVGQFMVSSYDDALRQAQQRGLQGDDAVNYARRQSFYEGAVMGAFTALGLPGLEKVPVGAIAPGMLKEVKTDKLTGEMIEREIAYGDPSSNAESMAFRRACAKFGLGLYLYSK